MKILLEYKQFISLLYLRDALDRNMKKMHDEGMMSRESIDWKAISGVRRGKLGSEDKKI